MNSSPPPASDDPLAEEAAHWCIRLHDEDCSEDDRQAFQRWLVTSPEHARKFAEMAEIWEVAAYLPPTTGTGAAPRPLAPAARPHRHGRLRRAGLVTALTLLVLSLAVYGGWLMGWIPDRPIQGLLHNLPHALSVHIEHGAGGSPVPGAR